VKLYFTRHGKTQWNLEKRLQGRYGDSPLLSSSLSEIEKLGDYLADFPFHAIYSSPSLRARKTAEGIAAKLNFPMKIFYREGLREFGLGKLEGVHIDIAQKQFPKEMHAFRFDLASYDPTPYYGETIESLLDRMTHVVVSAVMENKTEDPILFVSHGASLSAAIRHLAGFSLEQLKAAEKIENNTLSVLEVDSKIPPYKLVEWNNGSFL